MVNLIVGIVVVILCTQCQTLDRTLEIIIWKAAKSFCVANNAFIARLLLQFLISFSLEHKACQLYGKMYYQHTSKSLKNSANNIVIILTL